MGKYSSILVRHLEVLSIAHPLSISDDYEWLIVRDFLLPPEFNQYSTDVLVEIPDGYPCSPPGVGNSHVYLPPDLRYQGRRLVDLHGEITPGWGNWAWFCYEWIRWDPHSDDLVKFMEMIRADLSKPKTK